MWIEVLRIQKFLHVSTDEVYDSLNEDVGHFYETTPNETNSPYSASKHLLMC